jgi:general secretion pathway protein I
MSLGRTRGFTLIEVVIAFAILGMSLTALYGAFEISLRRAHRDACMTEATLIAQSLIARAGSELSPAGSPHRAGWQGYQTELTEQITRPARQAERGSQLMRATATVSWNEGGKDRQIRISTLKLLPERELP